MKKVLFRILIACVCLYLMFHAKSFMVGAIFALGVVAALFL